MGYFQVYYIINKNMGAPKDPEKRKLWIKNLSKSHTGKKQAKHKPDCQCAFCKGKRGEYKGKNSSLFGRTGDKNHNYGKHNEHHKPDCQCFCCKAKRGETKGEHSSMYRKKQKQSVKDKISKNMPDRSGDKHPGWKGGEYQKKNGRWMIWIDGITYITARYITMQCVHRKLTSNEEVHHINEDKSDDRPENLYLFSTKGEHTTHHMMKTPPILISNII